MNPTDFWKNFKLGDELSVSGSFIYNGLRRFYELRKLDHTDEIFEVFYYLSIGLERLMKVAIVLLEHENAGNQEDFEKSLITHNHQALVGRLDKRVKFDRSASENALLSLLTNFYESLRYDRFSLQTLGASGNEKNALFEFLERHLHVDFKDRNSIFGHENKAQYKKFIRKIVVRLSGALYAIVRDRAGELNLYTYELRHGSKAETVFLGEADMHGEGVLWKELLIFFMNTESTSGYLKFLRGIKPLDFDPALVGDYLDCFQSDSAKAELMGELESLYEDIPDKSDRLDKMGAIGASNIHFHDEDEGEDDDFDAEPEK